MKKKIQNIINDNLYFEFLINLNFIIFQNILKYIINSIFFDFIFGFRKFIDFFKIISIFFIYIFLLIF